MNDVGAANSAAVIQANEALFRRQIDSWSRNDIDSLVSCFDDDLVYTDMPFPDQPVRGKSAFRDHMAEYNGLFLDGCVEVDILSITATENRVAGELFSRITYVGPGAPEGGIPISWHAILVDTITNGKIVSEHAYYDPSLFDREVENANALRGR